MSGAPPGGLTPPELVHHRLLERWRHAMNLVGPGPSAFHFLDAAAAVDRLAGAIPVTGRWADLGSGAGFPGIALAARCPAATVELVESRQRRAAFLEEVVAAAGLSGRALVRWERVERLAPASFDGVVARAWLPPRGALEAAAPLLVPGGVAALLLGEADPDGEAALDRLAGCRVFHVERYRVADRPRRLALLRRETT